MRAWGIILITQVAVSAMGIAGVAPNGGQPRGPPPESIAACTGSNEEDTGSFNGPDRTVSGICVKVRSGVSACVHSQHYERRTDPWPMAAARIRSLR